MDIGSTTLLPFLIPLGVVVLLTLVQISLLALGGVSLGLDLEADLDLDVDADVDLDVDLDVDADVDADVDSDAEVSLGLAHAVLSPLGLGRVPLTVIWQAFAVGWGLSGVALTYALHTYTGLNATWFLAVTLPGSLVPAWWIARGLVRLVAPLLRISGQAESEVSLIGKHGVVTSLTVDAEFGEVVLTINGATNHVVVRAAGELIPKGSEVVVVEFDVNAQRPVVALIPSSTPTSKGV